MITVVGTDGGPLPAGAADPLTAEVAVGPLFWVHALYTYGLMLPATAVFVPPPSTPM